MSAAPTARACRAERGVTLIEVGTVAVLIGIVVSAALPRFALAVETTRVDQAAAVLRSIERSQRMYRLETGAYAGTLSALHDIRLLDAGVVSTSSPFSYRVVTADAWGFTAEADRDDTSVWFGTLTVDETGEITGTVSNGEGDDVRPAE